MYKILLADDEFLEREALKIILQGSGENIEVVGEATNGREAIELDEKLNPDIVFMDLKMPGIDGMKASEIIKNRDEDKVIVILTAYDDFELIHKALTLGVNDYILKPVRMEKLLQVLRTQIVNLKTNKNRIREQELILFDKIISKSGDAERVLDCIIESYKFISNDNMEYFKEKIQSLGEKIVKLVPKLKTINESKEFSIYSLNDMNSICEYIGCFVKCGIDEKKSEQCNDSSSNPCVIVNNSATKILEPALKYIEENYKNEITLEKIAGISNVSTYYFSKLFKKQMGTNFITYLNDYKIQKSKEMLIETDIPIVNIASELGYYECGYFTKVFKKIEGITPTKYREMKRQRTNES